MPVFVKASRRAKAHYRKGAGGHAMLTGHDNYKWTHGKRPGGDGSWAFQVTTRSGMKKTVWRRGMFGTVSRNVMKLQTKMRSGFSVVKILT